MSERKRVTMSNRALLVIDIQESFRQRESWTQTLRRAGGGALRTGAASDGHRGLARSRPR
ncbi:hypothetical protein ACFWQC_13070 [Nocardioides sp. NPDC058538]|uniref:hypothetical protein n=1 Tax=Nocardioides sp. NPDC058538 TaxID=3346542 RepID=UPI00364D2D5B